MLSNIVTIYNNVGLEIGKKLKSEIDKKADIFQTVYARVFVGDKILLTKIIKKEGAMVKTNEGKWGLPIATIIRDGEEPQESFERASLDDIQIIPKIRKSYEKRIIHFKSTPPRIIFAYDAEIDRIPEGAEKEYMLVQLGDLENMYKAGELAETAMIFS